jgi:putative ABC transport system permease protein
MFAVVRAVLLDPLPFPAAAQLVTIEEHNPGWSTTLASSHAFLAWRDRSRSFERMAAAVWWDANLESGPEPARVNEVNVSPAFFETLGLAPAWGRVFRPDEIRRDAQLVVLSDGLWRRLGSDPNLVGQAIRLNGESYTVIGVMPPVAYDGPFIGWGDLWVPWALDESSVRVTPNGWRGFRVVARLGRDVGLDEAEADIVRIERQLARELPALYEGYSARVRSLAEFAAGGARPRCSCSSARCSSCGCCRVPTSPTACSSAARHAKGSWPSGAPWVRPALGW